MIEREATTSSFFNPFLLGMDVWRSPQNIPAQTIQFNSPSQQKFPYSFSCQPQFYRHTPHFLLPKTAPIAQSITKETFAAITKDAQKYGTQSNQKIVKDLEKTVCEQAAVGTIFCTQKQIKPATTIAHFCWNLLDLMKLLVENGTKKTAQFLHDQKTSLIATVEKCVDHAQKIMFEIGDLKPFPLFTGNELWHENISVIRSEMFHHISKLTAADAASITFSSLLSNYSPVAACLFSLAHFLGSITSSLPPTLPPFAFSASGLASVAACVTPAQLVVAGVGIGLIGACKKRFFEQPIIMRSEKLQDKLPNLKKAVIDTNKFTQYALNPDHPIGKHKAYIFKTILGYTKETTQILINKIKKGLSNAHILKKETTIWGEKFEIDILIEGLKGNSAFVKTSWIIEKGSSIPRLVTAYIKDTF